MDNKRILIIDDDLEIWGAYQAILAPAKRLPDSPEYQLARLFDGRGEKPVDDGLNFDLHFARQGLEAVDLARRSLSSNTPFAMAFIDIRMPPGIDGAETSARIHQIDPNIEMVIVTAYSDRSRDEVVQCVGSPDKLLFLRKPFDPEEILQIALSLTEKWKLARQEETQKKELETLFTILPTAIFTVDRQCQITSWNPAAERITGYSSTETIGRPCIIRQRVRSDACNPCFIGSGSTEHQNRELLIEDKNGDIRTIYKSASALYDASGRFLKGVESFWDITERKAMEAALHASETRFRSLVETLSDWVWETDARGIFTYCSPISAQIHGYPPEELLGRSIFETLAPKQAETVRNLFSSCIERKCGFRNIERKSLTKNGSEIHVEFSAEPVINEQGDVQGFRGVDRDITERKETEAEHRLLKEQQRQRQKMEALGTLAGGIAHDINNVLTPIIGNAQLALLDLDPTNPVTNKLNEILKGADKAARLIRQILAFSRKQISLQKPIDLNSLIRNFFELLRRMLPENIALTLSLDEELWPIIGDASQIEQILINLVVNARDAVGENGKVIIRTRNTVLSPDELFDIEHRPLEGNFVVMSVEDNGTGIESSMLGRIFDPFFTTKDTGKGTGMGLSMVYGFVKQHDATIRIESEIGRGTALHIYFKKSDHPVRYERGLESGQIRKGTETILLVEDNADVKEMLTDALTYYGYTVMGASNGLQAMELFNKHARHIDLIVTDIVMPELGGRALAKNIRKENPDFPIVFVSGHPLDMEVMNLDEHRFTAFLQKPFSPQNIAKTIRDILDQSQEKNETNRPDRKEPFNNQELEKT